MLIEWWRRGRTEEDGLVIAGSEERRRVACRSSAERSAVNAVVRKDGSVRLWVM